MCRKRLSSPRCRSELINSAWVVIVPGQKCINKKNKIITIPSSVVTFYTPVDLHNHLFMFILLRNIFFGHTGRITQILHQPFPQNMQCQADYSNQILHSSTSSSSHISPLPLAEQSPFYQHLSTHTNIFTTLTITW